MADEGGGHDTFTRHEKSIRPRSISKMLNKKIMVSCKIFAAHFGDFFELQALEDESFAVLKERIATSLRQRGWDVQDPSSLILLLKDGKTIQESKKISDYPAILASSETPTIKDGKNICMEDADKQPDLLLSYLLNQEVDVFVFSKYLTLFGSSPLPPLPIPPPLEANLPDEIDTSSIEDDNVTGSFFNLENITRQWEKEKAKMGYRHECARARGEALRARYSSCCRALFEFLKEVESMEVMCKSVASYKDYFKEAESKAQMGYEGQKKNYEKYLSCFDENLEALRKIPLHPSLYPSSSSSSSRFSSSKQLYLIDLLDEKPIIKWKEQAQKKAGQWEEMLATWRTKTTEILQRVDVFQQKVYEKTKNMKEAPEEEDNLAIGKGGVLKESREGGGGLTRGSLVRNLGRLAINYRECKEKLDVLEKENYTEIDPREFKAVDASSNKVYGLCQDIDSFDEESKAIAKRFGEAKQSAELCLRDFIKEASDLQFRLKKCWRELDVFKRDRERVEETFLPVKIIHNLPQAYEQGVKEIHRRVAWKKQLSHNLESIERSLITLLNEEYERRREFNSVSGTSLLIQLQSVFQSPLPNFNLLKRLEETDTGISGSSLDKEILEEMSKDYPLKEENKKTDEEYKKIEEEFARKEEWFKKTEEEYKKNEGEFKEREKKFEETEKEFTKKEEEYKRRENIFSLMLRERDANLTAKDEELKGKDEELKGKREELKGKEEELKGKEEEVKEKEEELGKKAKENEMLKKKQEDLEEKLKEIEELKRGREEEFKGKEGELVKEIEVLKKKEGELEQTLKDMENLKGKEGDERVKEVERVKERELSEKVEEIVKLKEREGKEKEAKEAKEKELGEKKKEIDQLRKTVLKKERELDDLRGAMEKKQEEMESNMGKMGRELMKKAEEIEKLKSRKEGDLGDRERALLRNEERAKIKLEELDRQEKMRKKAQISRSHLEGLEKDERRMRQEGDKLKREGEALKNKTVLLEKKREEVDRKLKTQMKKLSDMQELFKKEGRDWERERARKNHERDREEAQRKRRIEQEDEERRKRIEKEDEERKAIFEEEDKKQKEKEAITVGILGARAVAFQSGVKTHVGKGESAIQAGDQVIILPGSLSCFTNSPASSSSSHAGSIVGSMLLSDDEEITPFGPPYQILVSGTTPHFLHAECYDAFKSAFQQNRSVLGVVMMFEEGLEEESLVYGMQKGVRFVKVFAMRE